MTQPMLCYVKEPWAYFTTQPLDKQWGDDWNDAPYEHNAEEPYEPCWHNLPRWRNDPTAKRGWRKGTQTPLEVGELCQCDSCLRDWNEDGTPKWFITKLAWDGRLNTPSCNHYNSPWSVEQINAGAVAWLTSTPDVKPIVVIHAGATIEEFIEKVKQAGGKVYRELPSTNG